jgi:hypothetical protein
MLSCKSEYFRKHEDYSEKWEQVKKLKKEAQLNSALKIVKEILSEAETENNYKQIIKATVYILNINRGYERDYEKYAEKLEKIIPKLKFPYTNITYSILADIYLKQLEQYTSYSGYEKSDYHVIEALDIKLDKVIKAIDASLEKPDELKKLPSKYINEILIRDDNFYYPSLFELLANKAINVYTNRIPISLEKGLYLPKSEKFFSEASEFINMPIECNDSLSCYYRTFKLLQEITDINLKNNEPLNLIDSELKRLIISKSLSIHPQKDSLYEASLIKLSNEYKEFGEVSEVYLQLMIFYLKKAERNDKTANLKALNTAKKAFKEYPDYFFLLEDFRRVVNELGTKKFSIDTEKNIIPNQDFIVKLNFRHVDTLYIKVHSYTKYESLIPKNSNNKDSLLFFIHKKFSPVTEKKIILPHLRDANIHSVEYVIEGLPKGRYTVYLSDKKEIAYNSYYEVSNINVNNLFLSYRKNKKQTNIIVCNRKTGRFIQNANISLSYTYWNKDTIIKNYTTDKNGSVYVPNRIKKCNLEIITVKSKSDKISQNIYGYSFLYDYDDDYDEKTELKTHYFTDRAVYRPGDKILFKGIVTKKTKGKTKTVSEYKTSVIFKDRNYKTIATKDVKTNSYGSFSGSFEIPINILNGTSEIESKNGSTIIKIEEYKTPKFEIIFHPIKEEYILNDTIIIKGTAKAFAGYKLPNARVNYRVIRNSGNYYPKENCAVLKTETTKTNKNGEFIIKFKAKPGLLTQTYFREVNFKVDVAVTDINGETQEMSKNISPSKARYLLETIIPEMINKKKSETETLAFIKANNFDEQEIKVKGVLKIYKLTQPKTFVRHRLWENPDTFLYTKDKWDKKIPNYVYKEEDSYYNWEKGTIVFEKKFNTEYSNFINLDFLKNCKSGYYYYIVETESKSGNKRYSDNYILLFNEKEKKLPYPTPNLFIPLQNKIKHGEKMKFIIGSSENDISALLEVEHKGKIVWRKTIAVNNEQKIAEIPVLNHISDFVFVHCTVIKENRTYYNEAKIDITTFPSALNIKFIKFKDVLEPGKTAEWKLKIRGKNNNNVEMAAVLYDASLDKYSKHKWNIDYWSEEYYGLESDNSTMSFQPNWFYMTNFKNSISCNMKTANLVSEYSSAPFSEKEILSISRYTGSSFLKNNLITPFNVEYLNIIGDNIYGINYNYLHNKYESQDICLEKSGFTSSIFMEESPLDIEPMLNTKNHKYSNNKVINDEKIKKKPRVLFKNVRKHFDKTAFFYPHLKSNSKGEITLKFKVPESITKWKMLGFAHTKNFVYTTTENELVTRKKLMVIPNLPRFLRESDKTVITAKLVNLSDKKLSGFIKSDFKNTSLKKQINDILISEKELRFELNAGETKAFKWEIKVPSEINQITCTIIAESKSLTDGEENVLPVLPNRKLITESLPFSLNGKSSKLLAFKDYKSDTFKPYQYIIEYTSSPVWYAIKSLPYLTEYPHECSEQLFSRFFANTLALHIIETHPEIEKVLKSYEKNKSNSKKNTALYNLLTEESPAYFDTQNESEQMKQIALFLDKNHIDNELKKASGKLIKQQLQNGAFPWFDGMSASRHITQYIISGTGTLKKAGLNLENQNPNIKKMIRKAVKYSDSVMYIDYINAIKNNLQEKYIGYTTIQYLYARSFYTNITFALKHKKAFKYYINVAKNNWKEKNTYSKGQIAIALFRFKEKEAALKIVKTLKEISVMSEEFGMYWQTRESGYYWNTRKISLQALMVDVFNEIAQDKKAVSDIQLWLIKNKRTNRWGTTVETTKAINSLLINSNNITKHDKSFKIKIGKNKAFLPYNDFSIKKEYGSGYFNKSWQKKGIKSNMNKIQVSKQSENFSWGAYHRQYFEDFDKIKSHNSFFRIKRKIIAERINNSKTEFIPVSANTVLKIGDKLIVKLMIETDRKSEYIHIKDNFGAGFEPGINLSGYKWNKIGYYKEISDASVNFFIEYLPKGNYTFEYTLRVNNAGEFSSGIAKIQCMYAPEYNAHTKSRRIKVER